MALSKGPGKSVLLGVALISLRNPLGAIDGVDIS